MYYRSKYVEKTLTYSNIFQFWTLTCVVLRKASSSESAIGARPALGVDGNQIVSIKLTESKFIVVVTVTPAYILVK
jgi:hypothetical protein